MEESEEDLSSLEKKYIYHIICFALLFIIDMIIYFFNYWKNDIIFKLFLSFSIIKLLLYLIFPIIFLLIPKSKLIISVFKNITKGMIIISILLGIFFFTLIIINTVHINDFCKECPFNLSFDSFRESFEQFFMKVDEFELENKCQERRCILYENNEDFKYQYKYLCNYNPEKEFDEKTGEPYIRILANNTEIKTRQLLQCSLLEPRYRNIYFYDDIIYDYLDQCYFLADFYICDRFKEPPKISIKNNINEICPNDYYSYLMILLCIYIFLTDIIVSFIPWLIERHVYSSILKQYNIEEIKKELKERKDRKKEEEKQKNKKEENKEDNKKDEDKKDEDKKGKKGDNKKDKDKKDEGQESENNNVNNDEDNTDKNDEGYETKPGTGFVKSKSLNEPKQKTIFLYKSQRTESKMSIIDRNNSDIKDVNFTSTVKINIRKDHTTKIKEDNNEDNEDNKKDEEKKDNKDNKDNKESEENKDNEESLNNKDIKGSLNVLIKDI